nr:putative ribonuclease H-like domain-containing protein [Tanacetum cinerariifolium]
MALADLGASINLMPLSIWKKLSLPDLTPTRMTLELATRSYAYQAGIADDIFVQVGKFTFPADFVVIDYDVDPRVPILLRRPFLRTACVLVYVHKEELILRDGDEKLIFHADSTPKHPHKHGNESINMTIFINITCEDCFPEVLEFKKSNHPLSGSITPLFDFSPSLTPFETSDSLLEEFADELALLDPFPLGKEDNNFDFEVDLREIEYLLNQDPSTESIFETIDPILEKFTDERALYYLPRPRDDDDDLFEIKSDNDEWKKLLYGDRYKDIDSKKDKNKDSKIKSLVVEAHIVESNDLLPQLLDNDSTLPKESSNTSEIASLSSFPFKNEDKIPYGEIKVHIEVLSVFWGNRLPILDGSLSLYRGTIKTGKLDFENVYFVRELKFNLFSVLQMYDKKNSVLFNDIECIVLSLNFKLTDESHVLLKVPRKNNMYSVDLKNIFPKGDLTCLFAKDTSDESKLWHRRQGHLKFKTMNKLVKGNLVRGLPSKLFKNNQDCVACQMEKQHRASCKSKTENSISLPLHLLPMDLFGPTFVKSLMKKMYCLVVTNDYSRFTWVFFLASKDETSAILKTFITKIENVVDHKVKVIRCDNRTEFKIREMNRFYEMKGNQSNGNAGTKACDDACKARMETVPGKDYILLPLWTVDLLISQESKSSQDDGFQPSSNDGNNVDEDPRQESKCKDQEKEDNVNNTNNVNAAGINGVNAIGANTKNELLFDPEMPDLEDISTFNFSSNHEDDDEMAEMNNLDTTIQVSPTSTARIYKDHPIDQVIGDLHLTTQTRNMSKNLEEHGFVTTIH